MPICEIGSKTLSHDTAWRNKALTKLCLYISLLKHPLSAAPLLEYDR